MFFKLINYYRDINRFRKMPVSKVRMFQLERFRRLFDFAKEHSPFYKSIYKDAGVLNLKINTLDDIQKLPLVDKYVMRAYDYKEILTVPISGKLNLRTTSGSTGEPFRVYQNKFEDYTAHVRVFHMLRSFGYHPFRKITLITRYEPDDKFLVEKDLSLITKVQDYFGVFQREIISIYEDPEIILQKVEKSRPYILWTTPSVLEMICNIMSGNAKSFNIPYVVLTSEVILPHQFKKFNQCISKNIIDIYGLMECPALSFELIHKDKRAVISNTYLVEYVDYREEEGTKVGTPVVTNLVNFTMPFIRYNTHDVGEILDHMDFPAKRMGRIEGRLDDILTFPDGTSFVHHHAHEMFMDFEECEQFKFVQKNDGQILLQLKVSRNADLETIRAKAFQRWNRRFEKFPLSIEFVEKFKVNPKTGKFKNIERIIT